MKKKGRYYKGFWACLAYKIFPQPEVIFEEPITEGEPVVFTANHSGVYGPVNTTLYLPHPNRPWVVSEVLDKKLAAKFIFYDFFAGAVKKHKFCWRVLSHIVSFFLRPLLVRAGAIAVYHDRRIVQTFKDSMDALKAGNNIVVFPECPERFSEHINDFYGGFAKLGQLYYRETGKNLKFYPTYIAHTLGKILVGKPIEFNLETLGSNWRDVITEQLRDRTEELAKSLPPHSIQPFLSQEWYDAYESYWKENRMHEYWKLCENDNRKSRKHKKSKE